MIDLLKFIAVGGVFLSAALIFACLIGHVLKTRTKDRPEPIEHFPEGAE